MQRAVAEHARTARAARDTRAAFVAQRSSENLESLVAQRLEAEVCPALPVVQRQADLTLSHVADHFGSRAAVQLAADPERLSSYAGFKNAGAGLVKNFRTPGSSHTMPQLASAIQRFRDPMQRAAVESAAYAAFGSHPTYPKQLQRALEERDAHLEVQRESWRSELEGVAQRQAEQEASGEGTAGQIEAARGGGQALPENVKAMLEAKWNTDLSKVRVHTDSGAASISKKLNAKALTTGQDIFFGSSTFNPTSLEGLQLIAHEAWHTVQQANGLVQAGVDKSASLEVEARGKGAELSSGDVQTASSGTAQTATRVTNVALSAAPHSANRHAPLALKAVQRQAAPATLPVAPTTGPDIAYDTLVARLVAIVPEDMRPYAASSIPLLLQQSRQSDLRNPDQVAYILATARHEARFGQPRYTRSEALVEDHNAVRTRRVPETRVVEGRRVAATREEPYRVSHVTGRTIEGDNLNTYYDDAYGGRLGNVRGTSDAADFRGRGFVQLTGRDNYSNMTQQLTREGFTYSLDGVTYGTPTQPINLTNNPTHVNRVPELAARITVSGMRQGTFTGRGLNDHITSENTDFFNARRIVNGDRNTIEAGRTESNGEIIAGYARAFAAVLREGDAWTNLFPSAAPTAPAPVQRAKASIQRAVLNNATRAVQREPTLEPPTAPAVIDSPRAGINKMGFIDNDQGSNLRSAPAELGGKELTATPLPPATRVFVSGVHPKKPEWHYVTATLPDGMVRGYVQGFRVNTNLPEPTATLIQVPQAARLEPIAARIYRQSIQPGRDLRFYENAVLHVNQQLGRAGVYRGTDRNTGQESVMLQAGRRVWLVSPAFANTLEGTVSSGSITGGGWAKAKEAGKHLEDILSSVTGCGAYFNEVAGEYREAIMGNLPEIIGITAGFIAAEALSAFLAATPTGVGQLGAAVIQLGLAAFGAKGFVDAGGQALGHASDWLTAAWTANGDPKKIAAASKSFLKMLVSIAMAALALLGARGNTGKGLKLASGVKITPPRIAMMTAITPGGAAVGVPVFQPGSITAAPVALGGPTATMMTGAGVAGSTVKPKQDKAATAKQEAKDKAVIKKIENEFGVESAHGLRRHGSGTTLEQQQYRAKTGYTPDGVKGKPSDATRFLSNQSLLEAYQRAMTMWKKGKPFIDVDFKTVVAEGYYKGGVKYGTTEVVRVFFNQDGKIMSGFGKLP